MKQILGRLALSICATMLLPASSHAEWAVKNEMQIGGAGRWDYLTVDPDSNRLYVPRTTHTMVIAADSGKVIADIPGQTNAHGVALVPDAGRGFISDGGGNGAVLIFDLKTNKVLGRLTAQPDADGIVYDRSSGLVLVVSGDGGVLMTLKPDVDPVNGKIDAPIDLGGKPEFLAADGAGQVYINLEDKDQVAVVDLKARKVLAHWPVAPGGHPVGLSLDAKKGHLFIGCRNPQKLVVMSTNGGKILGSVPIGSGVDATVISSSEAFASCADGTLTVAKESSPGKFDVAQTVKTPAGARTMGFNPKTNTLYLPTAEMEPAKAGARPQPKPGTFKIVVVTNSSGQ